MFNSQKRIEADIENFIENLLHKSGKSIHETTTLYVSETCAIKDLTPKVGVTERKLLTQGEFMGVSVIKGNLTSINLINVNVVQFDSLIQEIYPSK